MRKHKHKISLSVLIGIFFLAGCSSLETSNEIDTSSRYSECESLADKATNLSLNALASGETNYESPEWQAYDKARDRYNILNCREWWPLPYS